MKLQLNKCKCGKTYSLKEINATSELCSNCNEKILKEFKFISREDCKNKIDGTYQEICSNCKRFYGCYFEA